MTDKYTEIAAKARESLKIYERPKIEEITLPDFDVWSRELVVNSLFSSRELIAVQVARGLRQAFDQGVHLGKRLTTLESGSGGSKEVWVPSTNKETE